MDVGVRRQVVSNLDVSELAGLIQGLVTEDEQDLAASILISLPLERQPAVTAAINTPVLLQVLPKLDLRGKGIAWDVPAHALAVLNAIPYAERLIVLAAMPFESRRRMLASLPGEDRA